MKTYTEEIKAFAAKEYPAEVVKYAEGIRKDPYRRNMRAIVQYEERGLSERNVLRHLKEKAYPFIAAAVPVYHASIAEVIEAHKAGQGACQKYAVM